MNLVVGKFYPPHKGHHYVIEQALADGPTIVVILWSNSEIIWPDQRLRWLQEIHPGAVILARRDELPADFGDPEVSKQHAHLIDKCLFDLAWLDGPKITKVFGSEEYVDHLAEYFGAEPVCVDPERVHIPISGTKIRQDPRKYWTYLREPVRADLCKRVVCIGAESCGTTTLARDLAEHYSTVWVPEYGRMYSEGIRDKAWTHQDLMHIASAQNCLEDRLAHRAEQGVLICDTNSLATRVWEEFLVGESDIGDRDADLFIITDLCSWEDDGLRFFEDRRIEMQSRLFEILMEPGSGRNVRFVQGDRSKRLKQAIEVVDQLTWDFGSRVT